MAVTKQNNNNNSNSNNHRALARIHDKAQCKLGHARIPQRSWRGEVPLGLLASPAATE